ncbi:alanine racemase [Alicyclobacillus mali]|uniref:Alanine racemase n=1 Tax=Alicyclobacillus mali (ex Roth et al. 2021) TaxID=1123961 RepID=A0ABS0F4C7_9BACL|nr:alanine racemase [Alicyclobacillus mali (ex Roth et al. 2021)]MBF8378144.1 alanine racemase [Alicyclobacillus mali (ex Roth et al. 2021)]
MYRPLFAVIDLAHLSHNIRYLKSRLRPDASLMVAVKADAYGHGVRAVVSRLAREGVRDVAVASLEEALEIRAFHRDVNILVLGAVTPDACAKAAEAEVEIALTDLSPIDEIPRMPKRLRVHLPLDTGMNRLGVKRTDEAVALARAIAAREDLELVGAGTHLAAADADDPAHASGQMERLKVFARALEEAGVRPARIHAGNSAALLRNPAWHLDMVRVGIAAYGYSPDPSVLPAPSLRPVMSLYAGVLRVARAQPGETVGYGATFAVQRPMSIATVAGGYADGYPRHLSNQGDVLVGGDLRPVIGRVCMDQLMVDVTGLDVATGDFAALFGYEPPALWREGWWNRLHPEERAARVQETYRMASNREERRVLSLDRLAALAQTIPYEILCRVHRRVPRVVCDG